MILNHHDRLRKPVGKARREGRAGCPDGQHNDFQRASQGDPCSVGPFWPIAASLVAHNASAWLPPRAMCSAKIRSVTVVQYHQDRLKVLPVAKLLAMGRSAASSRQLSQPES